MGWLHLRDGSPAIGLCVMQMITALVATAVVGWFWGGAAALAALFGGIVAIVPAAYFAAKVRLRAKSSKPADVLGAFYRAEFGKLVLTALLFWIGALMFGAHFAPLMLTCIACLAMNWLMLAVVVRAGSRPTEY